MVPDTSNMTNEQLKMRNKELFSSTGQYIVTTNWGKPEEKEEKGGGGGGGGSDDEQPESPAKAHSDTYGMSRGNRWRLALR
mmetsp:Transcript_14150/g.17926  ORF Transcript_14150/g.17926 Transcript_14150/m.17926 type:complete len:81 (+) Transcript_14150:112-354(+)